MKRIIVTGSSGFIGSHLMQALEKRDNIETIPYDIKDDPNNTINNEYQITSVAKQVRPDVIVHLAGQPSPWEGEQRPFQDAHLNIEGTLAVLRACRSVGASLVFSSSGAVYGSAGSDKGKVSERMKCVPLSHYGVSKLCAEEYIHFYKREHGLDAIILRFSSVYGPGGKSPVNIFCEKAVLGDPITIYGDGSVTRDYTHVDDVVQGINQAVDNCFIWGHTYNIASGSAASINQLLKMVEKAVSDIHSDIEVEYVETREGDIPHNYFDIKKAEARGYKPMITLPVGVSRLVKSLKEQYGV